MPIRCRDWPMLVTLLAVGCSTHPIADTLDYALSADYTGPFDIIVADDGSTDLTGEIVSEYAASDPRVRLLEVEHGGKANALNAALAIVSAPLVATIDADTLLMPYSLRRLVARLTASPPDQGWSRR